METKAFDVKRLTNGRGHSHLVIVVDEAEIDVHIGTVLIVPYAEGFKDPIKVVVYLDDTGKVKTANQKFAVVAKYIYNP
jgi:hypothetical protein